jgi:hypothetical protein
MIFLGDFAEKLPDFQMMEIMQFIITSLPTLNQSYEETTRDSKFVISFNFSILTIDFLEMRI